MELSIFIQLIFLTVLNIAFACAGIALNSIVVVSFLFCSSSSPLRRKLCNFMIMVLAYVDLIVVVTSHAVTVLRVVLWLNENQELFSKIGFLVHFSIILHCFSFLTILVMSIERYLAVYYPFFHLSSVTRRRLLSILAASFIFPSIGTFFALKSWLITCYVDAVIFCMIFLPTIFLNYKLFMFSRNLHRHNRGSTEASISDFKLKEISTCLLVFACFIVMSIPTIVFFLIILIEKGKSENTNVLGLWTMTVLGANSTMNCLIFFWKNKILRTEAEKVLKNLKDRNFSCFSRANLN